MSVISIADRGPSAAELRRLESLDAEARVAWALKRLPGPFALTSSFGAQAAVMLHLVTRQAPDTPVILVDTGHLFPETYAFVDRLTDRLGLELHVFRPDLSPAWQQARYGKEWEQGREGIDRYNQRNKVEPLRRAFEELGVSTWFTGVRRSQAESRQAFNPLERRNGRWKVMPIVDWTDRDVYLYLQRHELPYHPLWSQGYVSIGDVHSTRSLAEVADVAQTRFGGLKRECGIHEEL